MKKIFKLLAAIIVIYFITNVALPKLMTAATLKSTSDTDVIYQTWEKFLDSGVKIEYGEVTTVINNENDK